jgi:prepilin-type N-terminal cleavage/methylation domain-containing protein
MRSRHAFSLLELLIVVAVIAVLVGIAAPALSAARRQGLAAACATHLRELGDALQMYGNDYEGRCLPLAYWTAELIGEGPVIYWWGTNDAAGVDHERGFVWPYLQSPLGGCSVFECPEQPWGSYKPQGAAKGITSTYGYNGYYLSPEHTPGWGESIGHRPWQMLSTVRDPSRVFAFADTLIDLGGPMPYNNALLEPARLFFSNWEQNDSPTTAFRHRGAAQVVHADSHVDRYVGSAGWVVSKRFGIGSVGAPELAPHYVPDWREWRQN